MSDPNLEPTEDPEDAKVVGIPQKDLKALRERGRKADEAEARAAKAERELAFARANIDPETPGYTYFVKGYEGDLTPEAIKAAAVAARLIEGSAPSAPVTDEEQAAHQRVAEAAAGVQGGPPNAEAERDARLRAMQAGIPNRPPSPQQERELDDQLRSMGVRYVGT